MNDSDMTAGNHAEPAQDNEEITCKHKWQFESEMNVINSWGGLDYTWYFVCEKCGAERDETDWDYSYFDDRNWE